MLVPTWRTFGIMWNSPSWASPCESILRRYRLDSRDDGLALVKGAQGTPCATLMELVVLVGPFGCATGKVIERSFTPLVTVDSRLLVLRRRGGGPFTREILMRSDRGASDLLKSLEKDLGLSDLVCSIVSALELD